MLLLLALVSVALAHPSGENFDGDQVFRVSVEDEEQINLIHELANAKPLDFWKPDSAIQIKPHSTVDFHVKAEDTASVKDFLEENEFLYDSAGLELLMETKLASISQRSTCLCFLNTGIKVTCLLYTSLFKDLTKLLFHPIITPRSFLRVLMSNMKNVLDAQFDSHARASGHSYTKYNNWETIEAWTQQVASENPDLISRSVIGTTFEGRNIYILKVGKAKSNKPAVFMDCGFHAREWISPAFCQWFVREAVLTYGKETQVTELLNELDFYVLPVINIDGYVYTWTKDRMWRKTRSTRTGSSCAGVDPNRNFDAGWCEVGASRSPCSDTYCGPTAESEKETKALANFIRNNLSSIKAYLTIHSYSQMILYPYSYAYKLPKNHEELNTLVKGAAKKLATPYGTKYTYGPGATTIYLAAGGSDDWAYDQGIKYSFTFELRDTGTYGFLLPESQIRATCEETLLAVKYIADYIKEHLY